MEGSNSGMLVTDFPGCLGEDNQTIAAVALAFEGRLRRA